MAKLTISIVNYNAGGHLLSCLRSLKEVKDEVDFEVWVVDNASSDGIVGIIEQKYPWVCLIKNQDNLGFGKAHNQVIAKTNSPLLLFLNPDSKILPGTLKFMVDYMVGHKDVGVASCKVEKADGSLDWASHRGLPTPWASFLYFFIKNDRLYHLTDRNLDEPHEVDSIVGAFFLTRREVLEKVGNFDEDYWLYAEDIDLCYRIKQAGYKVMYVPQVKIIHLKGVSSGIKGHSQQLTTATLASKKRAFDSFYYTMILFYKKHLAKDYPALINWLVYTGINLKWFLAKRKLEV